MTRITSFGRKRTHLEAGFSNDLPEQSHETLPPDNDGQIVSNNESAAPPKKKRKRTKLSMRDGNTGVKAAQAAAEREKREVDAQLLAQQGDGQAPLSKSAKKKMREKHKKDKVIPSEPRRQKRIQEKLITTTCFACREKGHSAKDCPLAKRLSNEDGRKAVVVGICYRCGSSSHTLSRCKKSENKNDPLPFALCFVCNEQGHLASSCPQNKSKGVYPNGGYCKLCGATSHLARDCSSRKQSQVESTDVTLASTSAGADEDDFHALKRRKSEHEGKRLHLGGPAVGTSSIKTRKSSASLSSKKVVYF